ncbi:MAG: heavy metal-associated domain-containing protein [Anaerolineaceae bacterium]
MNTIKFNVPSMHCMHCEHTVKSELSEFPGVKSVNVSLDNKIVTVEYEAPATVENMKALLAEINYPVVE